MLLHLYPASFRLTFGRDMQQTFRDASQSAREQGGWNLRLLWIATLIDLLVSALNERTREGVHTVRKRRFAAWAGPLTLFVGAMWLAASIGEFMIYINPMNGETFWDIYWMPWLVLSFVILPFAIVATYWRFAKAAGLLAQVGLGICLAAVTILLGWIFVGAFVVGEGNPGSWFFNAPDLFVLLSTIGYLFFGIALLRSRALPGWAWLPVVAAGATIFRFVPEMVGVGNYDSLRLGYYFLHLAITGVCLMLFGYGVWAPRNPSAQETPASMTTGDETMGGDPSERVRYATLTGATSLVRSP